MSCLITDHRQYDNVDYPPSIVVPSAMYQPNQINQVLVASVLGPDGGVSVLHFDVVVRDPNVDQLLLAHIISNAPASAPFPAAVTHRIEGVGTLDRSFGFDIDLTDFDPGLTPNVCKKVELWVSSDFAGGTRIPLPPANTDDVASMTWFFALKDGSSTPISLYGCP